MLEYNQITPKKVIEMDGQPHVVVSSHVFRKQQRKPVNQTKLKNLISGKVTEHSFHQSEKVEEASIEKQDVTYLYNNRGEWWFCEGNDRRKRFSLSVDLVGDSSKYLKENIQIQTLVFNDEVIGVEIPVKVELTVTEAPPAVKGDTAQGGVKQVTVETGATITAPMFVNEGDVIRVNTETGEYSERVEKK